MHNSGNGNSNYQSYQDEGVYSGSPRRAGRIKVAGFAVKPVYFYVGMIILSLLALFFVLRVLEVPLVMHFSLASGALLLVANLRELLGSSYEQHNSTALLNSLVGGGLVFAWISQFLGPLFWVPAIALLAVAAPLALGRASVYRSYMYTARGMIDTARRTAGRTVNRWS